MREVRSRAGEILLPEGPVYQAKEQGLYLKGSGLMTWADGWTVFRRSPWQLFVKNIYFFKLFTSWLHGFSCSIQDPIVVTLKLKHVGSSS